jgi:hypothetical protein
MMVHRCCKLEGKFFVVYDCGNTEEKWLICKQHMMLDSFQKYIKEKKAL